MTNKKPEQNSYNDMLNYMGAMMLVFGIGIFGYAAVATIAESVKRAINTNRRNARETMAMPTDTISFNAASRMVQEKSR